MKIIYDRMNSTSRLYAILLSYGMFMFTACEDFVNIDSPITQIAKEDVFADDKKVTAAISGIYQRMFSSSLSRRLTYIAGVAADELTNYASNEANVQFTTNSIATNNASVYEIWTELYRYVYSANMIIEGLSDSNTISDSTRLHILGEAKFVRAFCYFYLVNLFGDVPLLTTTDYRVNSLIPRTSIAEINQKITADLIEAQGLLTTDYSFILGERARPNQSTATALLARVYLFNGDWKNAEDQAKSVIDQSALYSISETLDDVSINNNSEAIWQLRSVFPSGINTFEGEGFVLVSTPTLASLSSHLLSAFEPDDQRLNSWVGSISIDDQTYHYAYKYKVRSAGSALPITESTAIFRLAEQYLIRAEARANQNDLTGAIADLDIIRHRAGLPLIQNTTPSISQDDLLEQIYHERQLELFCELGHRWFDLKRTNRADLVLGRIKHPNWQPTDMLFPIPQLEMDKAPNLKPQNPGY